MPPKKPKKETKPPMRQRRRMGRGAGPRDGSGPNPNCPLKKGGKK